MNLIVNYFDTTFGPQIYWTKEDLDKEIADKIRNFIDLDIGETFFEINLLGENLKTINIYVEINSDWARGHKEMALLTVLADRNFKAQLFQKKLKECQETISSIPNIYKGFYKNDKNRQDDPEVEKKYQELVDVLKESHDALEEVIKRASIGTLLVLGLSKVGKSSILERLNKKAFSPNIKPTLTSTMIGMLIESYNFRIIDVSGQKRLRKQWWSMIKHPDAIIYVIDMNDIKVKDERYLENQAEFNLIIEKYQNDEDPVTFKTPLLICGNKIDIVPELKEEYIKEALNLESLTDLKYKIMLTSAKTGIGVDDGFKWLVQRLLEF